LADFLGSLHTAGGRGGVVNFYSKIYFVLHISLLKKTACACMETDFCETCCKREFVTLAAFQIRIMNSLAVFRSF
jgi:hypothetical protein